MITEKNNFKPTIYYPETKEMDLFQESFGSRTDARTTQSTRATVLTGKMLEETTFQTSSKRLNDHMVIARKVLHYVREKIPESGNYSQRSGLPQGETQKDYLKRTHEALQSTEDVIGIRHRGLDPQSREYAELAIETKVGNCGEMSQVGFHYVLEHFPGTEVAVCGMDEGEMDHAFIIIGDRRNLTSKDSDAVICDPWGGTCCPIILKEAYFPIYPSYKNADDGSGSHLPLANIDDTDESHVIAETITDKNTFSTTCKESVASRMKSVFRRISVYFETRRL